MHPETTLDKIILITVCNCANQNFQRMIINVHAQCKPYGINISEFSLHIRSLDAIWYYANMVSIKTDNHKL